MSPFAGNKTRKLESLTGGGQLELGKIFACHGYKIHIPVACQLKVEHIGKRVGREMGELDRSPFSKPLSFVRSAFAVWLLISRRQSPFLSAIFSAASREASE